MTQDTPATDPNGEWVYLFKPIQSTKQVLIVSSQLWLDITKSYNAKANKENA